MYMYMCDKPFLFGLVCLVRVSA